MSDFIELLGERKEQLEQLRDQILDDMRSAPNGHLRIVNKRSGPQYYISSPELAQTHPRGKYLKKDEIRKAALIAQRDYGTKLLKIVENQLAAISGAEALSECDLFAAYDTQIMARKCLIRPYLIPEGAYLEKWLAAEYQGKGFEKDSAEYYSKAGVRVRSKSEKIIADYLTDRDLPYHYEKPLVLGRLTVYPDFTILDLQNRRELYYEHFGKMDDPPYAEKAILKINEYSKAGYHLGDRLIATFETRTRPLDSGTISRTLEHFFPFHA